MAGVEGLRCPVGGGGGAGSPDSGPTPPNNPRDTVDRLSRRDCPSVADGA